MPDSFWGLARELWRDPSKRNFDNIRDAAMSEDALKWNYTHGVADLSRINPDSWVLQHALLGRPGNKEVMLDLLYDYRTNLELYPVWQDYFRRHTPPTLIVWGEHDVIFPGSGAYPYRNDLPKVDFNLLDTGHFALEEQGDVIAAHIKRFAASL